MTSNSQRNKLWLKLFVESWLKLNTYLDVAIVHNQRT